MRDLVLELEGASGSTGYKGNIEETTFTEEDIWNCPGSLRPRL